MSPDAIREQQILKRLGEKKYRALRTYLHQALRIISELDESLIVAAPHGNDADGLTNCETVAAMRTLIAHVRSVESAEAETRAAAATIRPLTLIRGGRR